MAEPSHLSIRQVAERAARSERLAAALRDNLRRRKEQARAREQLAFPRSKEPAEKAESGEGEPSA
jgi:hypothetical protein